MQADLAMKWIFIILTFVALLSTTDADLTEFKEVYFDALKPTERRSSAHAINWHQNMEFKRKADFRPLSTLFGITALPDPTVLTLRYPDPHCGRYVGVYVAELNRHFCNVTSFGIGNPFGVRDQHRALMFTLTFQIDTKGPFILSSPVYKLPPQVASYNQEQLIIWGSQHNVETVGPVNEQNLSNAFSNSPMTIQFDWLERLLKYNIYKMSSPLLDQETENETVVYLTRPILISHDVFEMCYALIAPHQNVYPVWAN